LAGPPKASAARAPAGAGATLIIFADGLPFDDLQFAGRLADWPYRCRVRPGFGYSINLHAELFAGQTPDDIGFFGEWTFDPARAPGRWYRRVLPLLDRVMRPYVLNRGVQAVLTSRYRPGRIMPNIPLARLGDFGIRGAKTSDPDFPAATLWTRFGFLEQVPTTGMPKGKRDAAIAAAGLARIEAGASHLYIPLPDLDGIGHNLGCASAGWRDHVGWLGAEIDRLAEAFLSRHATGDVFVLSDHGMADVSQGVPYRPEAVVGPQGVTTYLTFTDSTLLRTWVFDPKLEPAVASTIAETPGLNLVTPAERAEYGLTRPEFGTHIAVLDEGLCFEPSTFARHIPAAMHGYHPDVPSQHALLLHRGTHTPEKVARTIDVYGVLAESVARAV
jgi:hypothetical protein